MTVLEAAQAAYQRDVRFRRLADTCVAEAMRALPLDRYTLDEAESVARSATTLLLQYIYTDDAELNHLRTENARLRNLLHETVVATILRLTAFKIPNDKPWRQCMICGSIGPCTCGKP